MRKKATRSKIEAQLDAAFEQLDYRRALNLAKAGAELNSAHAMLYLGFAYSEGWGVKRDMAQAITLFEQAGKLKSPDALAWLALEAEKSGEQSCEIQRLYRAAVKAGSPVGTYNYAQFLQEREPHRAAEIVKYWKLE
jgi:TPR repeat protein